MKKIVLISPAQVHSVNSFSEARDITGSIGLMPNLALPTLAAMVPEGFEVTLVDETIEPVDFDREYDFVGITGYANHATRIVQLAGEFRRRGRLVGIGGPYASLSPEKVRAHADILFIGEGEQIWPTFLRDLASGSWSDEYRAAGSVPISETPTPDFTGLKNDCYWFGIVQTSRGCPFQCEFCDAIVLLGRNQRYKEPAQVVGELENLHRMGYRHLFMADDNFTANRRVAADILRHVGDWNRSLKEPLFLGTQLSIDVARSPDLLDLCKHAGLRYVFIGIETPNKDSLALSKKKQNVRADLVEDVRTFHRHGIAVHAGMIVGFDADTPDAFRLQYEYLQRAGIPIASVSILNAPDQTPLQARLRREGRFKEGVMGDKHLESNLYPLNITDTEMQLGMLWLTNKLLAPENFLSRMRVMAANMEDDRAPLPWAEHDEATWQRIISAFDALGPEFATLPGEVDALYRNKAMPVAKLILAIYKHLVSLLRRWNLYMPAIATLPAPMFPPRRAEEVEFMKQLLERHQAAQAEASGHGASDDPNPKLIKLRVNAS